MSPFRKYEPRGALKCAHLSKIIQHPDTIEIINEWVKKFAGFLFLYGTVGTGKSYIAAAILNLLEEQKKYVKYYTEDNLFQELKMSINYPAEPPDLRVENIAEIYYFILDDLGSTLSLDKEKSEWKKEMLFKLIDIRYSLNLPTIITSNLNKSDLKRIFHDRLVSRIYSVRNTVINMSGPDRRQIPQFEICE